ncbi:MAG: nitroreductase family protein [Candidatus Bipolaricaulia bacterium]
MPGAAKKENNKEMSALKTIRTRRVVREYIDNKPISKAMIRQLLEAARWTPSAGNRRIHKLVVVRDLDTIDQIRVISPGILGNPTAFIVICTDTEKAKLEGVRLDLDTTTWIDVGITAQNIMLAAHALGLGSCPLTSFSRGAIRTLLELPPFLIPEFIVQLGHPTPVKPRVIRAEASTSLTVEDLCYWERYPNKA